MPKRIILKIKNIQKCGHSNNVFHFIINKNFTAKMRDATYFSQPECFNTVPENISVWNNKRLFADPDPTLKEIPDQDPTL